MSEARTVRECANTATACGGEVRFYDGPINANPILDYHVIGPGSVVSPEGLEAAAAEVAFLTHGAALSLMDEHMQEGCRANARRILELAGIVCADEVRRLKHNKNLLTDHDGDTVWVANMDPGDTLYIKRREG
jgi:hypothetical protein